MARHFLGTCEKADTPLVRACDRNPTAPYRHRFLIAPFDQTGHTDEPDWMAIEDEAPGRVVKAEALQNSASIQDPACRLVLAEGSRQAGLPED